MSSSEEQLRFRRLNESVRSTLQPGPGTVPYPRPTRDVELVHEPAEITSGMDSRVAQMYEQGTMQLVRASLKSGGQFRLRLPPREAPALPAGDELVPDDRDADAQSWTLHVGTASQVGRTEDAGHGPETQVQVLAAGGDCASSLFELSGVGQESAPAQVDQRTRLAKGGALKKRFAVRLKALSLGVGPNETSVEPFFGHLYLLDVGQQRRLTENFYFQCNDANVMSLLPIEESQVHVATQTNECVLRVDEAEFDSLEHVVLVVVVEKVLKAVEDPLDEYTRVWKDKEVRRMRKDVLKCCSRLSRFHQPFVYTVVPLYDSDLLLRDRICETKFYRTPQAGDGSMDRLSGSIIKALSKRSSGAGGGGSGGGGGGNGAADGDSSSSRSAESKRQLSGRFEAELELVKTEAPVELLPGMLRSGLTGAGGVVDTKTREVSVFRPFFSIPQAPNSVAYHRLYVRPRAVDFSRFRDTVKKEGPSARNIAVSLQLWDAGHGEQRVPLANIHGRIEEPLLVDQAWTPTAYHQKIPVFVHQEIVLEIPAAPALANYFLLFTYFHVHTQPRRGPNDPIEEVLGYSVLPLLEKPVNSSMTALYAETLNPKAFERVLRASVVDSSPDLGRFRSVSSGRLGTPGSNPRHHQSLARFTATSASGSPGKKKTVSSLPGVPKKLADSVLGDKAALVEVRYADLSEATLLQQARGVHVLHRPVRTAPEGIVPGAAATATTDPTAPAEAAAATTPGSGKLGRKSLSVGGGGGASASSSPSMSSKRSGGALMNASPTLFEGSGEEAHWGQFLPSGTHWLPIARTCPPHVDLEEEDGEATEQLVWLQAGRPLFAVDTQLVSSVLPQSPVVNAFFSCVEESNTTSPAAAAAAAAGGAQSRFGVPPVLIESAVRLLPRAFPGDILAFAPLILRQLLSLLYYSDDSIVNDMSDVVFTTLLGVLDGIARHDVSRTPSGRSSVLEHFVQFYLMRFQEARMPVHRALCRAWVRYFSVFDNKAAADFPVHSWFLFAAIVKGVAIEAAAKDNDAAAVWMNCTATAAAVGAEDCAGCGSASDHSGLSVFEEDTFADIESIVVGQGVHIVKRLALGAGPGRAKRINSEIAFFLSDLFSVFNHVAVTKLCLKFVNALGEQSVSASVSILGGSAVPEAPAPAPAPAAFHGKDVIVKDSAALASSGKFASSASATATGVSTPVLSEYVFDFIRVISAHEHFVVLNQRQDLPQDEGISSPTPPDAYGLIDVFWKRHPIVGLMTVEVLQSLNWTVASSRLNAAQELRNVLWKLDQLAPEPAEADRIVSMYFPVIVELLDHLPFLSKGSRYRIPGIDGHDEDGGAGGGHGRGSQLGSSVGRSRRSVRHVGGASLVASLSFSAAGSRSSTGSAIANALRKRSRKQTEMGSSDAAGKEERRLWLTVVLHILRHLDPKQRLLRRWLQVATVRQLCEFLQLLSLSIVEFGEELTLGSEASKTVLAVLHEFYAEVGPKFMKSVHVGPMMVLQFLEALHTLFDHLPSRSVAEAAFELGSRFVWEYRDFLFAPKTDGSLVGNLCRMCVLNCNSSVQLLREVSCAMVSVMLQGNAAVSSQVSRMRTQLTVAVSKVVGGKVRKSYNRLKMSLKLAMEHAAGAVTVDDPTSAEIRTLRNRLTKLIDDSQKIAERRHDPEASVDLYFEIANGYLDSPQLRITWLNNLAVLHAGLGRWEEASQVKLMVAYQLLQYLQTHPRDENVDEANAELFVAALNKAAPFLLAVCPNAASQPDFDTGTEDMSGAAAFQENGLLSEIRGAAIFLRRGQMFEACLNVDTVLSTYFLEDENYTGLAGVFRDMQTVTEALVLTVVRPEERPFPTFFWVSMRVGERVSESLAADNDWVYKCPVRETSEGLLKRLRGQWAKTLDTELDNIVVVHACNHDWKQVEKEPTKVYLRVLEMQPSFRTADLVNRVEQYSRFQDVDTFEGRVPSNSLSSSSFDTEAWHKLITIKTRHSFPFALYRLETQSITVKDVSPHNLANDEIQRYTRFLRLINNQPSYTSAAALYSRIYPLMYPPSHLLGPADFANLFDREDQMSLITQSLQLWIDAVRDTCKIFGQLTSSEMDAACYRRICEYLAAAERFL